MRPPRLTQSVKQNCMQAGRLGWVKESDIQGEVGRAGRGSTVAASCGSGDAGCSGNAGSIR
jgi:hypothetical protein